MADLGAQPELGPSALHSVEKFGDAVCDVVADQAHAFDAVDAAFGRFVGVPVLEACVGHWVDAGFTSERDHDVDVNNEVRINECGCVSCDVDTDLGQGLSGQVVDGGARLGARRVHLHGVACDLGHQPRRPSATCRRSGRRRTAPTAWGRILTSGDGGDAEFVEEAADPLLDVVADRADGVDGLASGDDSIAIRRRHPPRQICPCWPGTQLCHQTARTHCREALVAGQRQRSEVTVKQVAALVGIGDQVVKLSPLRVLDHDPTIARFVVTPNLCARYLSMSFPVCPSAFIRFAVVICSASSTF